MPLNKRQGHEKDGNIFECLSGAKQQVKKKTIRLNIQMHYNIQKPYIATILRVFHESTKVFQENAVLKVFHIKKKQKRRKNAFEMWLAITMR